MALETPEIPEISELTETLENPESSINKNVESELEDREYCDDMETSSEKEDAIIKAFMSPDYDEMDKLVSYINSPLGDFFPVTDKMNGSAIKINDKDYEFNIDPEFIERVEKSKFYGREDEFPFDHVADLHELSELIWKGEINQRYHFLKLFPFSLGGRDRKSVV